MDCTVIKNEMSALNRYKTAEKRNKPQKTAINRYKPL